MYERKILINESENKLIGDELIVVAKKDLTFLNFALRFHIMPENKLIQTQGGDTQRPAGRCPRSQNFEQSSEMDI